MIDAGLNVVGSLVILEQQTDDKALAAVIREVRSDVEGGMLLSQAMARHPKVFDRLYISMIEAGEAAGILDTMLDRVAMQIEKEMKIKRRVQGRDGLPDRRARAFAILVLIGMLMFLVPVFEGIFADLGGELPFLTQIVVHASDLVRGYWFILFPAMGGAVCGFRRWKKTPAGRQVWDRFKLRVPAGHRQGRAEGRRWRASRARSRPSSRPASTSSRRSRSPARPPATGSSSRRSRRCARRCTRASRSRSRSLESPVFPPLVSQMVKVGEETGELERMLDKIADFYEDEVDTSIASLTSIVEPIMMMGVGAIIGVIVIAMYLPMFKLLELVQ